MYAELLVGRNFEVLLLDLLASRFDQFGRVCLQYRSTSTA